MVRHRTSYRGFVAFPLVSRPAPSLWAVATRAVKTGTTPQNSASLRAEALVVVDEEGYFITDDSGSPDRERGPPTTA
jgi:hypothetical protein